MGPIDVYLVRYAYCFGGSEIIYLKGHFAIAMAWSDDNAR